MPKNLFDPTLETLKLGWWWAILQLIIGWWHGVAVMHFKEVTLHWAGLVFWWVTAGS